MDKSGQNEHILVCVSPSPSNPKVVAAAARMAAAFQATLTAIYVKPTNYETLLEAGIRRRHFWSKPPLTEQIILNAPDIDVYIIPDSAADLKQQKEDSRMADPMRPTWKESLYTLLLLMAATVIGLLFTRFGFSEANIITIFILGVLIISVITVSPVYSVVGSLLSVLLFNCWFFIEPKFSFHTYETEYAVTFAIMLASSLITGTLANRMKLNARQSAREAFRTKVLLDTNQLLQKAERPEAVVETTAHQIITLLSRDVVIFPRTEADGLGTGMTFRATYGTEESVPDDNEAEIARWVFENQRSAGFRLDQFEGAAAQYHAICLSGYCYGVIAIRLNRTPLEPYENSIVVSILGECALALENLRNAAEKEQADLMIRKEQLRSNLLRSISHDIRTPLTSISGNASNLLSHYGQLDEETRQQIFSDIYDDAEWLIDLVENLLSISRIENGQMDLHLSSEVMGDVIDEALKHVDRNAARHHIAVRATDDILLVDMDARLIMQVLINLINNAVNNTPAGSHISIESRQAGNEAEVIVCDDGPGIPDDMKPHVFEMFYTGQNKVADGRRGMGLGLALCKAIVESHRGRIALTDNTPTGCCFIVSLPMKEVQVDE